ncbi:MAG: hypothetical protein JWQ29_2019 [Phenylobacterium sp.]|nr:hypothetical protein [Phenylobacterium sp.]
MPPARKLPQLTAETEAFWHGGESGQLLIYRCRACRTWFHPPGPVCRACASMDVGPEPVSGRGKVVTYTINRQAWTPGLEVPFVIAIVELVEQAGLRFLSNVINCPPEEVEIDMPVQVTFEQQEDIWLPLFERAAK